MRNNWRTRAILSRVLVGIVVVAILIALISSSKIRRTIVDFKSDLGGGLEREINVYTADGQLLRHYEGKIDIDSNAGGYVKFDLDGKRYIYYNCYVESIADID